MDEANAPVTCPVAPALCVLASGSSGNCSVLLAPDATRSTGRRVCLIDAGMAPRRTERALAELGISIKELDSVILTHLDHDHCHAGWVNALPPGARMRLHRRHAHRARRGGALPEAHETFEDGFELCAGVQVRVCMASHDDLGVASFRMEFAGGAPDGQGPGGACLGFATDLGRVTPALVEHLQGVDVLAIESNYCPRLQQSSMRPWFLKQRIMGGAGHLSNQQTLEAIEAIEPRSHVVFLHLSRECNRPEILAEMHAGADYSITIAQPDRPTRWVRVQPPAGMPPMLRAISQLPLFHPSPKR
jgi:ribonuclease BN (tRNA processing enzyme)